MMKQSLLVAVRLVNSVRTKKEVIQVLNSNMGVVGDAVASCTRVPMPLTAKRQSSWFSKGHICTHQFPPSRISSQERGYEYLLPTQRKGDISTSSLSLKGRERVSNQKKTDQKSITDERLGRVGCHLQ